jgi:hypothetical protein
MLFHLSEEDGIARFEPRSSPLAAEPVVWAITADRLCNYLVPRDCPRVTFYARPSSSAADVERFLGPAAAVVAIERRWFARLRSCRLYCYQLADDGFECIDEGAGYFVSRSPVVPLSVEVFDDVAAQLRRRGVELRVLPSLWALHDALVASSLQFSMIRMRNATPRNPTSPLPGDVVQI